VKPDEHDPKNDAEFAGGAGAPELNTPERELPTVPAPEPVHRWLDGESVAKADLSSPEAKKHVKFWSKVNSETDRRHRMKTPRGLDAIIMEKLEPPVVKDE
jgi:hypothetical protein